MTVDLTDPQWYVPLVAGTLIPFAVAWLTKLQASPAVKSAVAFACAGLTAVGAYLTDTSVVAWEGLVSAFVLAVVTAAASRLTVTGGFDTRLAVAPEKRRRLAGKPDFGFGRAEPAWSPSQLRDVA